MKSYGIGYIGESGSYNFVSAYLVMFLTNCIHLDPVMAGTVSAVALFAEVISGMIVGNVSDMCTSKLGRRRPYVLATAILMPIVLVLLMHKLDASPGVQFAYYLVLTMIFRALFSVFEIPYNALGAQITEDYDERTKIRTIARVYSVIGNSVGYILPIFILGLYAESRKAEGWQMVGIIFAAICLVSFGLGFTTAKSYDPPIEKTKRPRLSQVIKNIFISYKELFQLKAMRLLVAYKGAFSCAFALNNVGTLYFLKYNMGMNERATFYVYVVTSVIFFAATPVIGVMTMKMGKARQQYLTFMGGGLLGVLIFIFARKTVVGGVLFIVIFSFVQSGFWQISPSIFYDIVEVDRFVNGKVREGDVMSFVSVLGTLVTAVVVEFFGIFLGEAGFDPVATVQSTGTLDFLASSYMLFPGILLMIGALTLKIFPVNKDTFFSLKSAITLKESGRDYSQYQDDIDKILMIKK